MKANVDRMTNHKTSDQLRQKNDSLREELKEEKESFEKLLAQNEELRQ